MSSKRCSGCGSDVDAESRFCRNCGANLAASAVVTAPPPAAPAPAARGFRLQTEGPPQDGRFPVGIILGERYRILGLLGRGGMGEVYRAHDLKLEQQVALKFLPEAAAFNPSLMERFRSEVRISRQVSHRNVCRVYDLGDINGAPFISMEYVDGEDLASLLRRIGRLPGDKALEFARRLCAGLAAAHEKGVLHRDLKPANIMIDSRGQLLIMDFGLAAVANAITGHDIRSGTPAYMSPEQKDGREVTVRSDIYALGLVLAEMFSGSRPATDGTLSSTTKDVDPAVEKVIRRCVDPSPAQRFASALDVARALPGGDPLAEALAAGETPSPQMVAASDDTGVLSVRAAVACLLCVIAGLATFVFWGSRTVTVNMTPMPFGPDVLAQKAREMIVRLGYSGPPQDVHRRYGQDSDYVTWAGRLDLPERRRYLASGQPPELTFYYVQSPIYLVPRAANGVLTLDDPVRPPGAVDVFTDPQGRLRYFRAIPQRELASLGPFEWGRLFEVAGLDQSRWSAAEPQEIPPTAFDARAAWTGAYPDAPGIPLRIEAATWQGRPVFFEIIGPWQGAAFPDARRGSSTPPVFVIATGLTVVLGALLLAFRNFRSARGDLSGALRLYGFVFAGATVSYSNLAHHVPNQGEVAILLVILGISSLVAAVGWALYMALEPYVRRHWPQVLIGWSRVLTGRLRDPLVSGHILAGIAAGCLSLMVHSVARSLTGSVVATDPRGLAAPFMLGALIADLGQMTNLALALFFIFVLMRLVLRRTWLTAIVVFLVVAAVMILRADRSLITFIAGFCTVVLLMVVAMRFGVLALTAALIVAAIAGRYQVTPHLSAFFAIRGWSGIVVILAVALWCFRAALGERRLLKADLLDT